MKKKKVNEVYTPEFYNPYEDDFVLDYNQVEIKQIKNLKEGKHHKIKYPPKYNTYAAAYTSTKHKKGRVIEKIGNKYAVTEVW